MKQRDTKVQNPTAGRRERLAEGGLLSRELQRASEADFARNSLRESIPLHLDLIPLLFPCYSAVIPLLVPLLFRCRRRQFIPQIHETANVFETIAAKKTAASDFLPDNKGI